MRPSKRPAGSWALHSPRAPASHAATLVRTVLLAVLAIGGATWGLVRHYTNRPPPLRVPREMRARSPGDEDATLQAPDLVGVDDAAP